MLKVKLFLDQMSLRIQKLKKDLEVGLKAFFGVEHDVDFSVKVKDVIEEKTIKTGRVE